MGQQRLRQRELVEFFNLQQTDSKLQLAYLAQHTIRPRHNSVKIPLKFRWMLGSESRLCIEISRPNCYFFLLFLLIRFLSRRPPRAILVARRVRKADRARDAVLAVLDFTGRLDHPQPLLLVRACVFARERDSSSPSARYSNATHSQHARSLSLSLESELRVLTTHPPE